MAAILLIDDHDDFRFVLRRLLTLSGHVVREADDGVRSLRTASQLRPDAIVLDLDMRGTDGWEVYGRLKRATSTAAIPVIALAARQSPVIYPEGTVFAVEGYLTKPVDLSTFMTTLDEILAPRERARRGDGPLPVREGLGDPASHSPFGAQQ